MAQALLKADQNDQYALLQTYSMRKNQSGILRHVVKAIYDTFGDKILIAVGKSLHQLLTDETMTDIPQIQKELPIAKTQGDLLVYLQSNNPINEERITLKRLTNEVFTLTNSKLLFTSECDFNGYKHLLNNSKKEGYIDANDNSYLFHMQFYCNYVDQLKKGRKNVDYLNEKSLYSHAHYLQPLNESYRHIVQNLYDIQQGVNILSFGTQLLDAGEALKGIYGLNDEFFDSYFRGFCEMTDCGYYFCLNKEQLNFQDLKLTKEERGFIEGDYLKIKPVEPKKSLWPVKEDAEEEPEPVEEEKQENEGGEEKQEGEAAEGAEDNDGEAPAEAAE